MSKSDLTRRDFNRLTAAALGGMVTGEHGIGLTRKKHLALGLDEAQITLMKLIKQDFDPKNILNPGKIFV